MTLENQPVMKIHTDFGGDFEDGTIFSVNNSYSTLRDLVGGRLPIYDLPEIRMVRSESFDQEHALESHDREIASGPHNEHNTYTYIIDPHTGRLANGSLHRKGYISVFEQDGKLGYNIGPNTGVHLRPGVVAVYDMDMDLLNWLALGGHREGGPIIAAAPVWQGGLLYAPASAAAVAVRNPELFADLVDIESIRNHGEFLKYEEDALRRVPYDGLVNTVEAFREHLDYPVIQHISFDHGKIDHNGNLAFGTIWSEMKHPTRIAGFSFRTNGETIFYLPMTFSYLPDYSMDIPSDFGMLASWGYSNGELNPLGKPWIEAFGYKMHFEDELQKVLDYYGITTEDITDVRVHAYPDEKRRPAPFEEFEQRLATDWNREMYKKFENRLERVLDSGGKPYYLR